MRILPFALVLAASGAASAQEAAPRPPAQAACTAAEYRQFDFWIGDFQVENPRGEVVGENTITPHLDGCLLIEDWRGRGGMRGMSMNYFDPADGRWHQVFIDNRGQPAGWPPLAGRFENGAMVLLSPPDARPRTRWTWTRVTADKVRQMSESSDDGGKTWKVTWDSYYVRKR